MDLVPSIQFDPTELYLCGASGDERVAPTISAKEATYETGIVVVADATAVMMMVVKEARQEQKKKKNFRESLWASRLREEVRDKRSNRTPPELTLPNRTTITRQGPSRPIKQKARAYRLSLREEVRDKRSNRTPPELTLPNRTTITRQCPSRPIKQKARA
ncbi:hypothetical protein RRG08_034670 [Elysia crispata]|uniref:Uncharacterized protein n=1 Tax=Elysia crispata TaxID=231223 RepID=A0AAE0Z2T5_9GAST|nr:hypothetical protein RRG08_034670 [Elysia crispata]